jgi:hypothetical protein
MTDFQNWWDGYFHEINGQKETAQAAWQARGALDAVRIEILKNNNEALEADKEKLIQHTELLNSDIAELTAKLDKAKDGDCCTEGCIKCDARKVLTETQHWLCLDGQMVVAQLYNLVEILNDPMRAYPHNFSTPAKGNALLFGLCQEAADEIELLKAKLRELDNA